VTVSTRGLARVFFGAFIPLTLLGAVLDHFFVTHAPWPAAIRVSALLLAASIALSYVLSELIPKVLRFVVQWLERE
jgi:hypothetical protein